MFDIKFKASGILLYDKNKILFQHRDNNPKIYFPDYWYLPGGRVEEGETSKEAVMREIREETGYLLSNPILIDITLVNFPERLGLNYTYIEEYDGKQELNCYEGIEMKFFTKDEFENLSKVYPYHVDIAQTIYKLLKS